MKVHLLTPQDYWRAIVLYGNNVATYKPALADSLIAFAQENRTHVSLQELAQAFFVRYRDQPCCHWSSAAKQSCSEDRPGAHG